MGLVLFVPFSLARVSGLRLSLCLTGIFCTTALAALIYTSLLQVDYGVLDAFILQSEEDVARAWYKFVDIPVLLGIVCLVVFLLARKRPLLSRILSICLIMNVCLSAWYGVQAAGSSGSKAAADEAAKAGSCAIEVSRTHPNVLVFMLDMFTGDHIAKIQQEHPELLQAFDGFAWYPDTISEAAVTDMSLPSIIGGPRLAPRNLKDKDGVSLEDKIDAEITSFFSWLKQKNCTASILSSGEIDFINGRPYAADKIIRRFAGENGGLDADKLELLQSLFAASYGIFRAAPWSMRQYVYCEGDWLIPESVGSISHMTAVGHTRDHYQVLKNLAALTKTDDSAGHYTLLSNELTHMPWSVSKTTLEPVETDPCPETKHPLDMLDGVIPEHYYAEMSALKLIGDYLAELKRLGAYDNTIIVLVSDHCEGDSQPLSAVFGVADPKRALENVYPGRPGALLMVKPLKAHGTLRTDSAPMASSDVREIVTQALEGRTFQASPDRLRFHATGHWMRARHDKDAYQLNSLWQIKGSRLERSHWKELPKAK